jgi:hypothetical protein
MMTRAQLKSVAALLFGTSLAVVASGGPSGRRVEVEGRVYRTRNSSGVPVGPVVGAVISMSLESTTAVTDYTGHFHLSTRARVGGDEFYIISVQSGDQVWSRRTMSANMRRQEFVLSESVPR